MGAGAWPTYPSTRRPGGRGPQGRRKVQAQEGGAYDKAADNRHLVLMTERRHHFDESKRPPTRKAAGCRQPDHRGERLYEGALRQHQAQNIEVFTVAFPIDDTNAKKLVEPYATDAEHYYNASEAAKRQAAFSSMADSLRNLYIAK